MWSLAADWTQALAAVGGLGFIGWQIWQSRKASDLQILMDFLQKFKEHESALVEADHDDVKRQAFTELLNFLEVCAVTLNNELLQKNSRNIVGLKLRDSLSLIEDNEQWHDVFVSSVSSPETFEELSKYYKKNKEEIRKLPRAS